MKKKREEDDEGGAGAPQRAAPLGNPKQLPPGPAASTTATELSPGKPYENHSWVTNIESEPPKPAASVLSGVITDEVEEINGS